MFKKIISILFLTFVFSKSSILILYPDANLSNTEKLNASDVDAIYFLFKDGFRNYSDFEVLDLNNFIRSISKETQDGVKLIYPSDWDSRIYKTGMLNDMFIWNNISNLNVKTVIVRAKKSNVFLYDAEKLLIKKNNKIEFNIIDGDHFFPINNTDKTIKLIKDSI